VTRISESKSRRKSAGNPKLAKKFTLPVMARAPSASEMTYTVSGAAVNSTYSLTHARAPSYRYEGQVKGEGHRLSQ